MGGWLQERWDNTKESISGRWDDLKGSFKDTWDDIRGKTAENEIKAGAEKADEAQQAGITESKALWDTFYQDQVDLQEPWMKLGEEALATIGEMPDFEFSGEKPEYSFNGTAPVFDFSSQKFEQYKDPGYDFRLSEGFRALDSSGASRGRLLSGAQDRAVTRYGQDMASQEYANAFNRYEGEYDRDFQKYSTDQNAALSKYSADTNAFNSMYNAEKSEYDTNMDNAMTKLQMGQDATDSLSDAQTNALLGKSGLINDSASSTAQMESTKAQAGADQSGWVGDLIGMGTSAYAATQGA